MTTSSTLNLKQAEIEAILLDYLKNKNIVVKGKLRFDVGTETVGYGPGTRPQCSAVSKWTSN
jgi:hypothetical protein